MDRIYKPLKELSNSDIENILFEGEMDELITLPLSVGEYHSNWKYAQDICIKLTEYSEPSVRANAILGLSYIARNSKKLEKHIVKPIILRELKENKEFEWRIKDAIEDINLFMGWNIGKKTLEKR